MMRILLSVAPLALLAACANPDTPEARAAAIEREAEVAEELAEKLRGLVPGEPVSCIQTTQVRSSDVIGERVLLYKVSSNLIYRNDPAGGCPGLDDSTALVTRTTSTQLCSGEIATVADLRAGFSTGSCVFSEWVPYRRPNG